MKTLSKILIALMLILALFLIEHGSVMFSDKMIIGHNDWYFTYIPQFILLQQSIKQGFLPVWTDKIGGGFPLAAYGYGNIFHPLQVLIAWLTPDEVIGIKVIFILSTLIASLSVILALKLIGIEDIRLWMLGAVSYHFTFFFTLGEGHLMQFVYMFAPLILVLAYKTASETGWKHPLCFGFLSGLSVLAFFPQFHIRFLGLVIFSSVLLIWIKGKDRIKRTGWLLFSCVLIIIAAFPQIKMTYELYRVSDLGEKNISFYIGNSIPFSFWNFFKNYRIYEGTANEALSGWWHHGGLMPLVYFLGVFSFFDKNRKLVLWLWTLVLIAVFFSLGKYNPFYVFLARHKLIFSLRLPARMLYFLTVVFPLLAVIGIRNLVGISSKKFFSILAVYLFLMLFMNMLASLAVISIEDWRMPLTAFNRFFDKKIWDRNFFPNMRKMLPSAGSLVISKRFAFAFMNTISVPLLIGVASASAFVMKKIKYRFLVYSVIFLIIVEGLSYEIRSDIKNAFKLEEYRPAVDVSGFEKLYTYKNWDNRNKFDLGAESNIYYGIFSGNTFQRTLYMHDYREFLLQAEEEIERGIFDTIRLTGVDGIVSRYPVHNALERKYVGEGFSIYRIDDDPCIVWLYDGKDYQKAEDISIERGAFDLKVKFINSLDNADLIIGRNIFKGFAVFVDGKQQKSEKFFSFYKLQHLQKGPHTIDIKLSFKTLFMDFH
ncbi:MAG: hypothetical protein JW928_01295 [Candidatus Aureabacteria bacterium]|nr:hypothetical protein [Candidatus Auribacterota bacterium]